MIVFKKSFFQLWKTISLLSVTALFITSLLISSSQAMPLGEGIQEIHPSYSRKRQHTGEDESAPKRQRREMEELPHRTYKIADLLVDPEENNKFQARIEFSPTPSPNPTASQLQVISQSAPTDIFDCGIGAEQETSSLIFAQANVPPTCSQKKNGKWVMITLDSVHHSARSKKGLPPLIYIQENINITKPSDFSFSQMSYQEQLKCILKDVMDPNIITWTAVERNNFISNNTLWALRKRIGYSNMCIESLRLRLIQESEKAKKSPQDYVTNLCVGFVNNT